MVSWPVLTAAPDEALELPLTAKAFCAALRAELLKPLALDEALAAVVLVEPPVTVPEGRLLV